MTALLEFLSEVPFFCAFSAEQLQRIEPLLKRKIVPEGVTLFLSGDPGDSIYVVKRGRVEIFVRDTTGSKVTLTVAGQGEIFGELSLLDKGPRSASAVTAEECELLWLEHDEFERLIEQNPEIVSALLVVLAQRLRQADDLLRGHSVANLNEVAERKLSFLQKLAAQIADSTGSVGFLTANMSVFAFWIIWNIGLIPSLVPIDPFPFGFLTMVVSLEAIFLSIIVLLAQNLQRSRDRIRGDLEYEVNLKAELEITHLHTKVDLMHAEILARLHRLEKALSGSVAAR